MRVQVKRPRDPRAIRALIRERDRHIQALEQALSAKGLPLATRRHLQMNLRGEKANRQSWVDYLAKQAA